MNTPHRPVDSIIEQLQERAKELHTLYQVHELTNIPGTPLEEVCRRVSEVLPAGWQFSSVCWARVTLEGTVYQPPDTTDTPWRQFADVILQGESLGLIEVFYTRQMPRADEGPFLKEERKLINTVAERLAHFLMQRRLQSTLSNWQSAMEGLSSPDKREWLVIIDFLRKTDQQLLMRISRRMLNYLCWNGIQEAIELLGRFATDFAQHDTGTEDNSPLRRKSMEDLLELTDDAFKIAAESLSEGEIVSCIQKWIKDDKSGFLVEAVENQCTSLSDIGQALDRYHQLSVQDVELSPAVQVGLRVNLARRFFTEDLEFINTAKRYIGIADFYELVHHIISTTASHGKLGGKSSGMLLASQIVKKSDEYADLLSDIKVPKTWYIASDGLMSFVEYNQMEDVYNRKYLEIEQIRRRVPAHRAGVQELEVRPGNRQGALARARRSRRAPAHRPQLQPPRGPDGGGLLGQVQEPLPGERRHQERAPQRPDGRHRRGLRLVVRRRPDRIPRRAEPPRPPRGDGHHDPGGGRHPGRPLLHALVRRRGVQQQRVPVVAAHSPRRRPGAPGARPRHPRGGPRGRRLPGPRGARPAGPARQRHQRRGVPLRAPSD